MKKYMVVYSIDGEPGAMFTDDSEKAEDFRMNTECGMGGLAEVYIRQEPSEENDYDDSYTLLYC